jgi:hypothetical protein
LDEGFDLAVSLEVAEHIVAASANTFVESLTRAAPLVMFSAAIPHQGGGGGDHVNEQWPEYWVERFATLGYVAYDCIRQLVWDDPTVAYYYAQNTFIFVDKRKVAGYRVHPRRWLEANDPRRQRLPPLVQALPHSISNAVKLRVRRTLGK